MLPRLAEQVGEFVAASTFYCSEFYLEADLFRRLSARFRNSDMRSIMEDWVFLRDAPYLTHNGNPVLKQLIDRDESIRVCCYELRHKFMTRGEALIHGDLHTSNVFPVVPIGRGAPHLPFLSPLQPAGVLPLICGALY